MQITIFRDMRWDGVDYTAGDQSVSDVVAQAMIDAGQARLTTPVVEFLPGALDRHAAEHAGMGDFATAAQGAKADTAMQPGTDRALTASDNAILADVNALITANHDTVAINITISADATVAWPAKAKLTIYQAGAAAAAFVAGDGVTLRSPVGLAALAQYGIITAVRVGANEWTLK